MVAFHRRTNPQPQWAYEGSLGHFVVERWDIPYFRIGRYEYTNMERRNCTFVSTTHVSLMEMMGGLLRARQQNIYGVTQTSCSALCTKLTLVGVVAGTIVDNGETNPTIDLVRRCGRHVGDGVPQPTSLIPPPLEQRASSIPSPGGTYNVVLFSLDPASSGCSVDGGSGGIVGLARVIFGREMIRSGGVCTCSCALPLLLLNPSPAPDKCTAPSLVSAGTQPQSSVSDIRSLRATVSY